MQEQGKKIRPFLSKNGWWLAGVLVGGLAGLGYWYFVGCASGSCPITSKPVNSILYFAAMGALLASIIKK